MKGVQIISWSISKNHRENDEGLKIETYIVRTLLNHGHVHITWGRTESNMKWNVILIGFGEIGRKVSSLCKVATWQLMYHS